MDSLERIWSLIPEYKRPESPQNVDLMEFVAHQLGYQFVSGGISDGTMTLITGVADPEEVQALKKHLETYFPGLHIAYKFRPRPMCYYVAQPGDTWESISVKVYGCKLYALELFNENQIHYTAYDQIPKITEPPRAEEYVYVPKIQ